MLLFFSACHLQFWRLSRLKYSLTHHRYVTQTFENCSIIVKCLTWQTQCNGFGKWFGMFWLSVQKESHLVKKIWNFGLAIAFGLHISQNDEVLYIFFLVFSLLVNPSILPCLCQSPQLLMHRKWPLTLRHYSEGLAMPHRNAGAGRKKQTRIIHHSTLYVSTTP